MGFGLPFACNILIEGAEDFLSLLMFPHNYISLTLCPSHVVPTCSVCLFISILSDLIYFPLFLFSLLGLDINEEFTV